MALDRQDHINSIITEVNGYMLRYKKFCDDMRNENDYEEISYEEWKEIKELIDIALNEFEEYCYVSNEEFDEK